MRAHDHKGGIQTHTNKHTQHMQTHTQKHTYLVAQTISGHKAYIQGRTPSTIYRVTASQNSSIFLWIPPSFMSYLNPL